MRKQLMFALVLISVLLSQVIVSTPVLASSAFNTSCGANRYSVDRITGQDQFTNLACFNENQFADALARMQSEASSSPNVVVRHPESPSPMKIVAADRAMAYSQNDTYLRQSTINIFSNKELTLFSNYINQSNPLYYYSTLIRSKSSSETIKPSDLVAHVEVNAAKGYIQLVGIDVIPLIYVENRWLITYQTRLLDTFREHRIFPNVTSYTVADTTITTKQGSTTVKQLSIRVDNATIALTHPIDIAPSWLSNGTYFSPDGIHFYTDIDLKNIIRDDLGNARKYFNYYSHLNLRSRTNYTGAELDQYFDFYFQVHNLNPDTSVMRSTGQLFVNAQETYGMNALMIYAMAIHESAYGRSNYAVNRNNLFGYNAFDSNPDSASYYASVEQAINQHMGLNLRTYLDATNTASVFNTFYGSHIGNKGAGINTRYASDPFWSIKISSFSYRIDRYLGFKDHNNYSIAILSETNRTYFRDASLQNQAFSINARATNYPNIALSSFNDTYVVQSTNPIVDGAIITSSTPGLVTYNWSSSLLYINQQNITLHNNPRSQIIISSGTDILLSKVLEIRWIDENQLYIKGRAILNSTPMDDISRVNHTLTLKNLEDSENVVVNLNTIAENFNNFNGLVYNSVGFDGTIDMSLLPNGSYSLELTTRSRDTTGVSLLREPALNPPLPDNLIFDSSMIKVILDSWNTMEYQIIKSNINELVTISSRLPSEYMSVARFYDVSLTENNQLNITGLGYINNSNMGLNDQKAFKLLLSNIDSSSSSYVFDLEPKTGAFNPSIAGNDYSYAWFNESLDFSGIEYGTYKLFLYIKSNSFEDVVEIRDFSFRGNIIVENTTRLKTFEMNLARRNYDLLISQK